jgi:hypothetical protein
MTYDFSPVPDNLQGAAVWVDSDSTGFVYEEFCQRWSVEASGYEDFCFGVISWARSGDSGGPLVGRASPDHIEGSFNTVYRVTSFGDASGCSSAIWDSVAQGIGPHLAWVSSFYGGPSPGDELFFYRSSDGAFRYYDMKPNATLGTLLAGGTVILWVGLRSVLSTSVDDPPRASAHQPYLELEPWLLRTGTARGERRSQGSQSAVRVMLF